MVGVRLGFRSASLTASLAFSFRNTASKFTRFASASAGSSSQLPKAEEARNENWRRRVDLATAYRGFEKYSLHEGVCNHLSMMSPAADGSGENVMLIVPFGLHWSEVTASSLIGLNNKRETVEGEGEAEISAATIHWGVHEARPDAVCAFHLHPPYATALSLLKDPRLKMYHQNSCLFYNSLAYDQDYSGLSQDEDEGMRIAKQLGDKTVLFMCNHGVMVVGPTVGRSFDDVYYLERACMFQVLAQSTGEELQEIDDDIVRQAKAQLDAPGMRSMYCDAHFESIKRVLAKQDSQFMQELHCES